MLEELKKAVYKANIELVKKGLVLYTWGNVSGIDEQRSHVVIKPSGVDYEEMTYEDMVVVDMDGNIVEGKFKPSSDTKTHIEIYKAFSETWAVAHTHSVYATSYSQAGRGIIPIGTTHADYFYGDIPCTRALSKEEVESDYETNTGKVIVETIRGSGYEVLSIPGIIVKNHGPFTWGVNAEDAVYKAVVMEEVANIALKTLQLNPSSNMPQYVLDKHYFRKHGSKAYYGQ